MRIGEGNAAIISDIGNREAVKHDIPAPGYQTISGKRAPPASMGSELFCQLRNGWCAPQPWPVKSTNWIHTGREGDVVAVKRV